MTRVILLLLTVVTIICFCAPIQGQSNHKLPKFKKEFFDEYHDMAWYIYVHYDVPVDVTLAIIATETNYGRKKRMIKRGDLFGTGRTYKYTQAWDEFGRNMKRNYFKIDSSKIKKIMIIKKNISYINQ
tara:strand:+ start:225 stop:608 length:384 start_codon:yes stop_codon:yes gene_type:complete